jgi:hypothetical protein
MRKFFGPFNRTISRFDCTFLSSKIFQKTNPIKTFQNPTKNQSCSTSQLLFFKIFQKIEAIKPPFSLQQKNQKNELIFTFFFLKNLPKIKTKQSHSFSFQKINLSTLHNYIVFSQKTNPIKTLLFSYKKTSKNSPETNQKASTHQATTVDFPRNGHTHTVHLLPFGFKKGRAGRPLLSASGKERPIKSGKHSLFWLKKANTGCSLLRVG